MKRKNTFKRLADLAEVKTKFQEVSRRKPEPEDDFSHFEDKDWATVTRSTQPRTRTERDDDTLLLSLSSAKEGKLTLLIFRFGDNIIKKMQWSESDLISLFYDKEDPESMMLVRHPSGYTLAKEKYKNIPRGLHRLTIRSHWLKHLSKFRGLRAKYKISNNRLLIQADFSNIPDREEMDDTE